MQRKRDSGRELSVVKIGGALLHDPDAMASFWTGVRRIQADDDVIIVHGGGPQATALARRLGHEPRFIHGRRVTTDVDLDVALWTMRGELNTRLVAAALQGGLPAIGISGVDGGILRVSRRPPWQLDGEVIDFGWVGDVVRVDGEPLVHMLKVGFLPIIAPLGVSAVGEIYNVNADTVVQSLAAALRAERLLIVTAGGGVDAPHASQEERLSSCDRSKFTAGKDEGWIHGGMVVKLETAFRALDGGVKDVHILGPDDLTTRSQSTRITDR